MKIVIIEDERLTAKDLANTIKIIEPDAEIISILYSVEDAILYFKFDPHIDLIFSDIELSDGLCFDIFNKVNIKSPIIFCTAYQQYSLEAFQTMGIDYILKPFNKDAIEKTLAKYKNLKSQLLKSSENYDILISQIQHSKTNSKQSIIVNLGDKIIPISDDEIAFFYIDNNNVYAITFTMKRLLINDSLEKMEEKFNKFFRANRQYLINRKAVKDASQYFNRKIIINLTVNYPEKIIVGKQRVKDFLNWLESN